MGSVVTQVILLTAMAGAAIPAGGLLARVERIHPHWLEREFRHSVIAFGGGVLLAAVALVLVPHGVSRLTTAWVVVAMLSGGASFLAIDVILAAADSPAAQLVAMLADFVPECLALGAAFATNESLGGLLALMIARQNLPEGFNASRELAGSGSMKPRVVLLVFVGLAPLGPISGLLGLYLLGDLPPVMGFIMLFAAGGILYLTFQDLAPQARLSRHWGPPLGAVLGFLFGLIAQLVITP